MGEDQTPLITVVSVTFNDLAGIQRTRESVDAQNYPHIQHVIIDGASSDGTQQWLGELNLVEPSRFTSEPDRGIYDAMNKGAALAEGELIVFLNGGDTFPDANTASLVVQNWTTHRWQWAYGITVLRDGAGNVSRIHQMAPFSRVRLGLGLAAVPHQALWMRTDFFTEIGGFRVDSGVSADMDLCWKAAERAEPYLFSEVLAFAEEGGVSAHQSPGYYARAMRKNVKHYGSSVTGNRAVDAVASAGVVGLTALVQLTPQTWNRLQRKGN